MAPVPSEAVAEVPDMSSVSVTAPEPDEIDTDAPVITPVAEITPLAVDAVTAVPDTVLIATTVPEASEEVDDDPATM